MAAAILFKEVRKSVLRKIETDITDVVLTVPVKFTEKQKQALIDAANIAGYYVVSVIVEPVASCFNFVDKEQTSLGDRFIILYPCSFYIISYDFGGSTLIQLLYTMIMESILYWLPMETRTLVVVKSKAILSII